MGRDREQAEREAEALCKALALGKLNGTAPDRLTLGQIFTLWRQHRAPHLSDARRAAGETYTRLFLDAWGVDQLVADISQTQVDGYAALRRAGKVTPFTEGRKDARGRKIARRAVPVTHGTIHGDFRWLSSVFNWARGYKVEGRRLLNENPLRDGVTLPRELNVRRPVASHDRYVKTGGQCDAIDPKGRLRSCSIWSATPAGALMPRAVSAWRMC